MFDGVTFEEAKGLAVCITWIVLGILGLIATLHSDE